MDATTIRKLRGALAEERISHKEFAAACGLSRPYVGSILNGNAHPGELAIFKIRRAIETLGLIANEQEAARAH